MLFNSVDFLIFLPVVFCLYWFIFKKTLGTQNLLLLVASYFFYGWWSWKFLLLLAASTLLDYSYGFGVASYNHKKARFFLWLSIINNLGILGIFKYYNFFITEVQQGFGLLGLHIHPVLLNIALPVGISFYTFHGMSYVFDIYRGKQSPVKNITDYALFVGFFPLLVAGPIERASHLLPQIQRRRTFNYTQAVSGCRLILWGLFKKVVIADNLAERVDYVYQNYTEQNSLTLITCAIAFSFQIYGDFSGYSDIALGTAKLFGFEIFSNFKAPYFSRNIAEFWKRWHISLSSWFRDYLYIPLGGSKEGRFKTIRNVFIIFLVSGLWHGASWNFIVWGALHAFAFLVVLLLGRSKQYSSKVVAYNRHLPTIRELGQMLFTFIFVTITWIFFRADNIYVAVDYIQLMVADAFNNPSQFTSSLPDLSVFAYIIPLVAGDWWLRKDERNLRVPANSIIRLGITILLALSVYVCLFNDSTSFIYFQF